MMSIKFSFKLILVALLVLTSCSGNMFKAMSTKNSEEALMEEALKALDKKEYDRALSILTTEMPASRQSEPSVLRLTSEAYAGKCGLDAAIFIDNLQNISSTAMFALFYQPAVGIVVDTPHCSTATARRVQIGSSSVRSNSDNVYLTILSMFRIGANIQAAVDLVPAGVGGDGTLDASVCAMTNAQVDEVILGFGNLVENIAAVSAGLVGGGSLSAVTDISAAINSVCTPLGITCITTDQTAITNQIRDAYRDLLNTTEFGVGSVTTGGNPLLIVNACP